jgi:prepilin-type N-terminal cleavage/methylation domain-containing protein
MHIKTANGKKPAMRFTLIELLVTVAIIAILASMLLPVLGRARYRARLVTCTSMLKQNALAITMYAGEYDERYPYRTVNTPIHGLGEAGFDCGWEIKNHASMPWSSDDRPMWRGVLDIDTQLQCPLAPELGEISLDQSTEAFVWASYAFWCGGELVRDDPDAGMYKVGQRPIFDGNVFNVLIADVERVWAPSYVTTSHPVGTVPVHRSDDFKTASHYQGLPPDGAPVELMRYDKAYAFDDGSVQRFWGFDRIKRGVKVPAQPSKNVNQSYDYLPPMQ